MTSTPKNVINLAAKPSEREATRDEKRHILERVWENYSNGINGSGYAPGWSDEKIAADMKVPRSWVSRIREEYFGDDADEKMIKAKAEARAVLTELHQAIEAAERVIGLANERIKTIKELTND